MNIKEELRVTEPNEIAEARFKYKITKAYLDILHIGLHLVALTDGPQDEEKTKYCFDVREYKEHYGLDFDESAYRKMRNEIHSTMEKPPIIKVKSDGYEYDTYVFQSVGYNEETFSVSIVFSEEFKKKLVSLLEKGGKRIYYALPDTLQMRSVYSKKMYPILLEFVGKPIRFNGAGNMNGKLFDRIYPLEQLKDVLGFPKSYVLTNIKDTCNTIVAEIEAYTPYHAEVYYNQIAGRGRYGGKTTHICWIMKQKQAKKADTVTPNDVSESHLEEDSYSAGLNGLSVEVIMNMTGLDKSFASRVYNKAKDNNRDLEYFSAAYSAAQKNGAKNLGALLSNFMEYGFTEAKELPRQSGQNRFNNFSQRKYDYDALEKAVLKKQLEESRKNENW